VKFVASPRHADLLLVTGPVSRNLEVALKRTFDATPEPKWVVAIGDCGCTGGMFGESYASCGKVSNVIPVDVEVPGCPPTPTALFAGHSCCSEPGEEKHDSLGKAKSCLSVCTTLRHIESPIAHFSWRWRHPRG